MTDITAEDIQTITLKQVIINHQYNDLAFLVRDRLMVFVEAQSTWSANILIRVLLYLADTIQTYLFNNRLDIHAQAKLPIPKPEFYIIFTGTQAVPESFSLKNDFFAVDDCPIDLRAKVISAETEDIIGQYILFCRVLDDQRRIFGPVREAAVEAIRICRNRGVLVKYLAEREEEVIDIMITLFNQEYAVAQYGRSQMQIGEVAGIAKGEAIGIAKGEAVGIAKGRAQGETRGRIASAITIYREEMGLDDTAIVDKLAQRFGLTRQEAEEYMFAPGASASDLSTCSPG